jgi:hypothetical protein
MFMSDTIKDRQGTIGSIAARELGLYGSRVIDNGHSSALARKTFYVSADRQGVQTQPLSSRQAKAAAQETDPNVDLSL